MKLSLTTLAVTVVFLATIVTADSATAAGWGSLKGRFVYDGDAPEPQPINVTKDVEFCSKHSPVDESVVVGENGGLRGVVLFIRVGRGQKLEVHPDYEAKLSEPVVLDNRGCAFHSHVTLVRVGQPFILKNSDEVGHNTNAALRANGAFNVIIPANEEREMKFTKEERLPMPVACNIHPWMSGHLFVRADPYMAVSAVDGTFEIVNIPAGKHEFQFWQEASGYVKNVKFEGGSTDRRGLAELTIADGETLDLGDIKVPAALLQ
jgi:hypothetical protein